MADATRQLARSVAEAPWSDLPEAVRHEGARAVLNWLRCAIAGCRDDAVEKLVAALRDFSGPPQATLLGRGEAAVERLVEQCWSLAAAPDAGVIARASLA